MERCADYLLSLGATRDRHTEFYKIGKNYVKLTKSADRTMIVVEVYTSKQIFDFGLAYDNADDFISQFIGTWREIRGEFVV